MGEAIVLGLIALWAGLAARSVIRQKKAGKSCLSCGGDCAHCAGGCKKR